MYNDHGDNLTTENQRVKILCVIEAKKRQIHSKT